MKVKYLIGICLTVLFLMSLADVSASVDINHTTDSVILSAGVSDDAVGRSVDENVISSDNRDWYVNASAADGGDGSNTTPYKNFRSVLDNADLHDEDNVYFAGEEIYAGDGINVNLVIDKHLNLLKYGSGDAVFDAENKSGIFIVNAIYFNITDLTFQNGNSGYGGALYFVNGICNSNINATFINNTATSYGGGANYFNGEVSKSNMTGTYINNTADVNGGANCFFKKVSDSLITGTYINNTAKSYGGANFFFQEVLNSNISGMYNHNKAIKNNGGAIYFNMGGIIFGGTFVNNSADNAVGGAVYFNSESASSVYDSIFINNSAGNFSAVHLSSNDGIVSCCVFINNSADFGVVGQSWDTSSNMNVNNNIFLNNDVEMNVIDFADDGDVNADYNWFGNNANNYGAVLNVANVEIKKWLFLNVTADPSSISVFDTSDILFILLSDKIEALLPRTLRRTVRVPFSTYGSNRPLS